MVSDNTQVMPSSFLKNPGLAPFESLRFRSVTGPALRPGGLELTDRAVAACGWFAGQRVLDLGCGPGASAGHLAKAHGLRVVGLDLSPDMLAEARAAHPRLPLLRAQAAALPLMSASLDGVLSECVLSLCPDPAAVLAEGQRVLRPGGYLALSDLYLRQTPAGGRDTALPGCLGGARSRPAWESLVSEAGLTQELWEDHSPLLARLAAQLAWAHGSALALWGGCAGEDCAGLAARVAALRPGYFLLVARKKD